MCTHVILSCLRKSWVRPRDALSGWQVQPLSPAAVPTGLHQVCGYRHDHIIWVANALWRWEFLSVALSFPFSLSRFALKDGQLWLGHQQALMVSAPCDRSVYLVLTCYRIAGNFRGRQLSRINGKKIFAGKTFAHFSLLTPKDAVPPNFTKKQIATKPRNLQKFCPTKSFCCMVFCM